MIGEKINTKEIENINNNALLTIKADRVFKDMFNETQMDTLEWTVMQILNAKYEDIHGKVKVQNASLINSYKEERNKTVDLLIDYNGDDILIELNNNYTGNYMRNLLYAFNIILHHYNMGTTKREIIKNRCKVILVNLNWYPETVNYKKIKNKVIHLTPYPEDDTDDFLIKVININLDLYRDFCYDKINEWDKLWKLLTIQNEKELNLFIKHEKLLKQYQKKLLSLSQDKEYGKMLMNETIEENALFDQTYGVGYRKGQKEGMQKGIQEGMQKGIQEGIQKGIQEGLTSKQNEMIINMYKKGIAIDIISECSNLDKEDVERIIANKNK